MGQGLGIMKRSASFSKSGLVLSVLAYFVHAGASPTLGETIHKKVAYRRRKTRPWAISALFPSKLFKTLGGFLIKFFLNGMMLMLVKVGGWPQNCGKRQQMIFLNSFGFAFVVIVICHINKSPSSCNDTPLSLFALAFT
ncbi:uncharacterized protein F4822DRAFT_362261 [Hypoxylon trugodes]|uniref:uncharacterized protein n=1 Tax=Hypoxylon trugodes TaxID=326681 RepID=UPI00219C8405|nr:uncharacterized protein F4822DRAFT_362261 [Hypoxylon trugodes]KAI1384388.1 hypothetical protein F4822DRAFT_362261 [Hypoxylon trugodes]